MHSWPGRNKDDIQPVCLVFPSPARHDGWLYNLPGDQGDNAGGFGCHPQKKISLAINIHGYVAVQAYGWRF